MGKKSIRALCLVVVFVLCLGVVACKSDDTTNQGNESNESTNETPIKTPTQILEENKGAIQDELMNEEEFATDESVEEDSMESEFLEE